MHLHNFLVDIRNRENTNGIDAEIDRSIFVDDMCNNGIVNIDVTNDENRGEGG